MVYFGIANPTVLGIGHFFFRVPALSHFSSNHQYFPDTLLFRENFSHPSNFPGFSDLLTHSAPMGGKKPRFSKQKNPNPLF